MALTTQHKDTTFGVGDRVKVSQKIREGDKLRSQVFEGMVIGIKGRGQGKTFTIRRIGVGQIAIERIFPIASPTIEKVEIIRKGMRGVRRAKLYYTRDKPRREIEKIYSRAVAKEESKKVGTKSQKANKTRAQKHKKKTKR